MIYVAHRFCLSVQECNAKAKKKRYHYITFQLALSRSDFIKPKPVRFKMKMFKLNIKKTDYYISQTEIELLK